MLIQTLYMLTARSTLLPRIAGGPGMATDTTHLGQFRLMGRYNTWANGWLYEIAATLTDDERRRDLGAFFHSVHGTLNHLLLTDRHWISRFATATPLRFKSLAGARLE